MGPLSSQTGTLRSAVLPDHWAGPSLRAPRGCAPIPGLIVCLFKGKRVPPTKTRPLRQGSKKPLLEDDLQAAEKISSEPIPDESKSLPRGVEVGGGSGAQRPTPSFPTWAQKSRVKFEGKFLGTKQPFSDHWAWRASQIPTPSSEWSRASRMALSTSCAWQGGQPARLG